MTTDNEQQLETEAWYYTRMMFARGQYGSLHLRDGRLSFVTVADDSRSSSLYEKVDTAAQTIFDLLVDDIDDISYNWLLGALTVTEEGRRYIVSFAGPQSGHHFEDARRLITALTTLGRWRAELEGTASNSPEVPEHGSSDPSNRAGPRN